MFFLKKITEGTDFALRGIRKFILESTEHIFFAIDRCMVQVEKMRLEHQLKRTAGLLGAAVYGIFAERGCEVLPVTETSTARLMYEMARLHDEITYRDLILKK
jgi:hypothetical protein